MHTTKKASYTALNSALLVLATLWPLPLFAATADADWSAGWNLVMTVIVVLVAAGSAVLPVSALRYWAGYWKLVAAMPLLLLGFWCSWIVVAKLLDPVSHELWLLEIFGWAMLTMLYMATAMTAKRQFEKADAGVELNS